MEHLMLPAGVQLTEQEMIPCIYSDDYIGTPFLEYPSKTNASYKIPNDAISAWFQAAPSSHGLLAFQRFLQTWLFFGLLQEVLSIFFKHEDFVRDIPDGSISRSVLSTTKLPEALDAWTNCAARDQEFGRARAEQLRRCFQVTYLALAAAPTDFDANLKFAIAAVAETLMAVVKAACESKGMDDIFAEAIAWMIFDDPETRSEQFRQSGWCQAQAANALKHHQACQSAHFLSHLVKNQLESGHKKCLPEKCVGCQIDENYTLRHFPADCTCQEFPIEHDVLLKILDTPEEAIVLLDLQRDEQSDEITATAIPSEPDSFYVSLSHVWVDGLGNTQANAIPQCQLRRLFELLTQFKREPTSSSVQTRPYLWLDTLCCPVELKAKKKAMARMPRTYQNAAHVLVLESSLVDISHDSLSPLEIFARICTSAWMFRVWTLQEAYLAKKLSVQFSKGFVEVDELANVIATTIWPTVSLNMVWPLIHKAAELRFKPEELGPEDLFNLATALKHRDLSVAEDEPFCVAAFLGLDVGKIAEKETGRMEHVWFTLDRTRKMISRDIIFYVGARLATPGYRWAPGTMLHIANQAPFSLQSETPGAAVTEDGLLLSCAAFPISVAARVDGIKARSTLAALDTLDFLRDETGRWYTAYSTNEQRKHATDLGRDKTSAAGDGSLYEIITSNESTFEVLLQHSADQKQSALACVLVQVTQTQSPKHVHACRQFVLDRLHPVTSDLLNSILLKTQTMQQAEITSEIIKTAEEGTQSSAYRAVMAAFMGEVNASVDQLMGSHSLNVPDGYLGLDEYPRQSLLALHSRFYRNRHLLIDLGKVSEGDQHYCVD